MHTNGKNNQWQDLTPRDLESLAGSFIPSDYARRAHTFRVDSPEGARLSGQEARNGRDFSGIVFPYFWPGEDRPREYRLRRDNPEMERRSDGSMKATFRYVTPIGRSNLFYLLPDEPREWLTDISIPIDFVEGEKKKLALMRLYADRGEERLVIGLAGVWGWRSGAEKTTNENGKRVSVKGPLADFNRIEWQGRSVRIVSDTNVHTDKSVQKGLAGLAKTLQERGAIVHRINLPADVPGVNGIDDLLALKGADHVAKLFQQIEEMQEGDDAWEIPAPFNEYELPEFPVSALPAWVQKYVEGLSRATQTPSDLAALLALTVISGALAGNVRIRARAGWIEPLNIYTITAMPPATRKSAVFSEVVEPLEEVERSLVIEKRQEIAERQTQRRQLEGKLKEIEKRISKGKGHGMAESEARELAKEISECRIPAVPRLITSDVTPEAMASLLAEQDGRLAVLSPEGDLFDLLAGRYSNGAPSFDVILKGHAGDTLRVDRRTRSEFVERPALTIGLAVQPDVIRGLASKPTFRGRGLIGRFLYAWPANTVGNRKIKPEPLENAVKAEFKRKVKSLAGISKEMDDESRPRPRLLSLTPQADNALARFEEEIEPSLAEDGELGTIADWAGKLAGAILRISGILKLAEYAENLLDFDWKVDAETVKQAIEIGRYLVPHAQAAFAEMGADPLVEDAKHLLRWIERAGVEGFTKREAHFANRGRFKKVTELEPALELLEAQGYIRTLARAAEPGKAGRKQSQLFEVNPFLAPVNRMNRMNRIAPETPNAGNSVHSVHSVQRSENSIFEDDRAAWEQQTDPLGKDGEPMEF